jgi:hypothetical protein
LYALTKEVLLLESMCTPWELPILVLRDECEGEDQGLNYVAFRPTESALVKMCYKAGFPFVYRSLRLPEHEDFRPSRQRQRLRSVLSASRTPLESPDFVIVPEPVNGPDPWSTAWGRVVAPFALARWFLRKPWPEKIELARRFLGKTNSGRAT